MLVIFVGYVGFMFFKNKKDSEAINGFQTSLKQGDKVVTGSGIYGTVEKIVDTTDGKVVTLKISENAFIDVNIGAIYNIDSKKEVVDEPETPATVEEKPKETAENPVETEVVEQQKEIVEEKPEKEDKAE